MKDPLAFAVSMPFVGIVRALTNSTKWTQKGRGGAKAEGFGTVETVGTTGAAISVSIVVNGITSHGPEFLRITRIGDLETHDIVRRTDQAQQPAPKINSARVALFLAVY